MTKRFIDSGDYTWPPGSESQPAEETTGAPADPQDGCTATIAAPPPPTVIDCRPIDQKIREELTAINDRLARIEAIVSGDTVKELYTK